mgnify:CR=1 FL=1
MVWFGEALPEDAWARACAAIDGCDVLVVVGTSGLVHPAASLPLRARQRRAQVIEVNGVAAWRGLQKVTPFDIGQAIVDDLLQRRLGVPLLAGGAGQVCQIGSGVTRSA